MLFSSTFFIFGFLPILLLCYFIINNRTYRNSVLLIFSLIFYAWGEPVYVVLMLFSIINDYLHSLYIEKSFKQKKFLRAKILLASSIIVNLGLLFFFKYSNFLIININRLFNLTISQLSLSLPIGISFYTFQTMSYTIDVYRQKIKAQKNILTLGTYVALFPQLVAGPIVRYSTIEKELTNRKETLENFTQGLTRFIFGLGKKILIANQMAIVADKVYNSVLTGTGSSLLWLAALAYTFQIYFDFSGYSDMAIGLGKMFGFNFLENFNYPYTADSITDFWRKWHISLSTWFRDYVYIPLGGNRVNKIKWYRNIFIVWFLTGLWHGAAYNFILWGLYFGVLLIFEKRFIIKKGKVKIKFKFLYRLVSLLLIVFGWVIFRVEGLKNIINVIKKMIIYTPSTTITNLNYDQDFLFALFFFVPAIILSMPVYKLLLNKIGNDNYQKIIEVGLALIILVLSIILLASSSYNPFIYFRF